MFIHCQLFGRLGETREQVSRQDLIKVDSLMVEVFDKLRENTSKVRAQISHQFACSVGLLAS